MTTKSPLFTEILASLGEVQFNSQNEVSIEGFDLDTILKERASVTAEQLNSINDVLGTTSAAVTEKVGTAFVTKFGEVSDLNHLDFDAKGTLASIGVHMARPSGKEVRDYRDSISSRVTYTGLDSTSEVCDELAVMWAAV